MSPGIVVTLQKQIIVDNIQAVGAVCMLRTPRRLFGYFVMCITNSVALKYLDSILTLFSLRNEM